MMKLASKDLKSALKFGKWFMMQAVFHLKVWSDEKLYHSSSGILESFIIIDLLFMWEKKYLNFKISFEVLGCYGLVKNQTSNTVFFLQSKWSYLKHINTHNSRPSEDNNTMIILTGYDIRLQVSLLQRVYADNFLDTSLRFLFWFFFLCCVPRNGQFVIAGSHLSTIPFEMPLLLFLRLIEA